MIKRGERAKANGVSKLTARAREILDRVNAHRSAERAERKRIRAWVRAVLALAKVIA